MSERLYEKAFMLEEEGQKIKHPYLKTVGAASTLGAGIGGVHALVKKKNLLGGVLKGSSKGLAIGAVASLLLAGGVGIAQLVNKAREKGLDKTKQSIRNAINHAEDSSKLTNQEKTTIRNNGKAAIAKLDQVYNKGR